MARQIEVNHQRLFAAAELVIELVHARGGKARVLDIVKYAADQNEEEWLGGPTRDELEAAMVFLWRLGLLDNGAPTNKR